MIDSPDGETGQGVTEEGCDRAGVVFEDRSGADGMVADGEVEDFLVSSEGMVEQVKTALRNVQMGKHALQIAHFTTEDSLRSFIRALNGDEWLKYNAVIVCFSEDGCVTFGISRVEDGDFWQSCEGTKVLGDRQINVYTISEFTEIMVAMWDTGIAS